MTFFRLWQADYTSEENVLTEQMWFLPLISYWEVMTRIFCGYSGAPKENKGQNHLNIALLNVF